MLCVPWKENCGLAQPVFTRAVSGPFAGLYLTSVAEEICEATQRDMEAVRGRGCLYVDSLCSIAYLYAENPMGIYSSFYLVEDVPARALRYWELHPEKQPAVIYVPYYDYMTLGYFDRLIVKQLGTASSSAIPARQFYDVSAARGKAEAFTEYFDCEITRGEAGYILYVNPRAGT